MYLWMCIDHPQAYFLESTCIIESPWIFSMMPPNIQIGGCNIQPNMQIVDLGVIVYSKYNCIYIM